MVKAKLGEFVLYFTDISVRESDFLEVGSSLCPRVGQSQASRLVDGEICTSEHTRPTRPWLTHTHLPA